MLCRFLCVNKLFSLCLRQRAAAGGEHAREASVHGAFPAPLLLLQDPRPQTRLHRSPRALETFTHSHHGR